MGRNILKCSGAQVPAPHCVAAAARGSVSGQIDYPRYALLDRAIIRFIMWLTGGRNRVEVC